MILETFIAILVGTIGYNIYRTVKVNNKVHLLETQNDSMAEALMLPPHKTGSYVVHAWKYVGVEVLHYNMFSMDSVRMQTERCSECGLIHRFIIDGYPLALKKGLTSAEGFYSNGIRCSDQGCRS